MQTTKKQFREDGHRIDGQWNDPETHYEGVETRAGKKVLVCECGCITRNGFGLD